MFLVSVCFVSFWYQDHLYSVYAGLVGLRYPNPHKHSKRNHLFWYQGCTTCLYSWKSRWFWCQKSTAHAYTQNVKKNNLIYKSVPPISYRFQNHCFIFLFFLGICTCMCYALLASKSLIFEYMQPDQPAYIHSKNTFVTQSVGYSIGESTSGILLHQSMAKFCHFCFACFCIASFLIQFFLWKSHSFARKGGPYVWIQACVGMCASPPI